MNDPLEQLEQTIEKHWREHLPRLTTELAARGELTQAIQNAAQFTREAVAQLEAKGVNRLTAWELMREEWAILPAETQSEPEQETEQENEAET
jgi:hypothetical protein